jgi:hypothetical protein
MVQPTFESVVGVGGCIWKATLLCLECFELGMQQNRSLNRRLQVKGNTSIFHASYKGKKGKRQGSNG